MKKLFGRLFSALLMLAVLLCSLGIGGVDGVSAISVSDDVTKLIEAAQNLTYANRVEIVNLIADEANGYELWDDYESKLDENAAAIHAIISAGAAEQISVDTVERGLEEFKEYYDDNEGIAKYALNRLVEGLAQYSTSGYSFGSIKENIEDYTLTFDVFMNFMKHIKAITNLVPLTSNAAKTNLSYNTQLDVYLNLAAVLGGVDEQRIIDYKNKLVDLIEDVNDYSDTSQRDEFIRYLVDKGMAAVASGNGNDGNGGSGKSGGGGGNPAAPAAPVTPTVTAKPKLDSGTGTAAAGITLYEINTALNNSAPAAGGIREATIEVPAVKGAAAYSVGLPSSALNTAALNHTIEIATEIASLKLPSNMMAGTAVDNNVELVVAKADTSQLPEEIKSRIGSKPVLELSLLTGGRQVNWSNQNAPVTVSIAYTPAPDELKYPENIVVWYIDGQNNLASVPSGRYDAATGRVTFEVDHFSKYAVAFSYKTFSDLNSHIWAKRQIEVMASKGIVSGISADKYNPGDNVTRGDYLKFLINTIGLNTIYEDNFDDLKVTDSYYKEIAVAKKLGITTGIGNNKYAPEKAITRQDMMVLTAKALSVAKEMDLTDSTQELNNFSDQTSVAGYARASAAAMIRTGLINGDGKNINPYANTSRAEAAVIMYRIYNK